MVTRFIKDPQIASLLMKWEKGEKELGEENYVRLLEWSSITDIVFRWFTIYYENSENL